MSIRLSNKDGAKYSKCIFFYFKTPCQLVPINFTFFLVCATAAAAVEEINFYFFNVLRLNEVEGKIKKDENKKK